MADMPPSQDNIPDPQATTTPPPADQANAGDGALTGDAKNFVMAAHGLGIFFPIIAPLIIWLVKKDEMPQAEQQFKDSLNFQITWFGIAWLSSATCIGMIIGVPMMIAAIVFLILAVVSVNNGKAYAFPWKLDLIK